MIKTFSLQDARVKKLNLTIYRTMPGVASSHSRTKAIKIKVRSIRLN